MSRCRKTSIVALAGCLFLTSISGLHAQSDAETALQKARQAYQAEQFDRARDLARQASQTDARNPDVWLLVDRSHFQLGELVPEDDAALYAFYFAQSAFGVRKHDKYLTQLREAVKLEPEAYRSALIDGYLQVADRYNQAGQLDKYIDHLAMAVDQSPQTTSLHLKLATAFEEARKYEDAVQQWRLVLELEPEHPDRTRLLNLIRKHG